MKRLTHIGLDISGKNLAAVQLIPNGNKHTVAAAASIQKQDRNDCLSQGDAQRAMNLLQNRTFSGVRIVSAVPCELQLLGSFEIPPPDSGAPIDDITREELARESKLVDTEIESDWWVLPSTGKNGDTTRAIAVGLAQDKGRALVETMVDRGFEPVALDVRGLAMMRACGRLLEGGGKISTMVEVGDSATLTCVCLNGTIVYYRRVEEGLGTILQDVMREMNVDEQVAEALLHSATARRDDSSAQMRDLDALINTKLGQIAKEKSALIYLAWVHFGKSISYLFDK